MLTFDDKQFSFEGKIFYLFLYIASYVVDNVTPPSFGSVLVFNLFNESLHKEHSI